MKVTGPGHCAPVRCPQQTVRRDPSAFVRGREQVHSEARELPDDKLFNLRGFSITSLALSRRSSLLDDIQTIDPAPDSTSPGFHQALYPRFTQDGMRDQVIDWPSLWPPVLSTQTSQRASRLRNVCRIAWEAVAL